jgi:hypothetical protein
VVQTIHYDLVVREDGVLMLSNPQVLPGENEDDADEEFQAVWAGIVGEVIITVYSAKHLSVTDGL